MTTATAPLGAISVAPASTVAEDRSRLAEWIQMVIPDCRVVAPNETELRSEGYVELGLSELVPVADRRRDRDLPFRIQARYHVLPQHPNATVAHDWAADLLFAASDQGGFDIDAEPPDVAWWAIRGAMPQPVLRVRTMILRSRPEPRDVRLVEEPLVVTVEEMDVMPAGAEADASPASTNQRTRTSRRSTSR